MVTKDQERKALEQIREIELQEQLNEAKNQNLDFKKRIEDLEKRCGEYHKNVIESWNKFRAEEDKRIAAEEQIIRLKAKLYDMMMEKEEK